MVCEAGCEWGASYAFGDGAAFDAYIYGGRKERISVDVSVRGGREGGRTEENGDDEEDDDEAAYDGHWDSDLQILFVPRLCFIHKTPNVSSHIHNTKK